MTRPRSDAIHFSSHGRTTYFELCGKPSTEQSSSNDQQQSPDSVHNLFPDLPSPTQPLFPTKVSKLVHNNANHTSTFRKKGGYNCQSQMVPLVHVQHPTLISKEDTLDTIPSVSPGRSLRRQTALCLESDLNCPGQLSPRLSPNQSFPFVSSRVRSSSDIVHVQSPGMVSADSGRETSTCVTGKQDLENVSMMSYKFDSDDALSSSNEQLDFNGFQMFGDLDVEKSLSPLTLRKLRQSQSILQQNLQV